jgi:hypothetical protein
VGDDAEEFVGQAHDLLSSGLVGSAVCLARWSGSDV